MKHAPIALILAGAALASCARGPALDTAQVSAAFLGGALPTEDPASSSWDRAPEHPAKLMVQDIAEPRLVKPGVELLRVRALHNGDWIVFRFDWDDRTRDLIPDAGRGADAVAVQLPVPAGAEVPNPAMGEAGKRVQIAYWKAVWQDDRERAAAGKGDRMATLHPNLSIDHYPFQANPSARAEMERRFAPALAAGNPVTGPKDGAVQELVAEGFGTTTISTVQKAVGRGVWQNGRWTTTIARPLAEGDGLANLSPGRRTYVAFAVWDGAERHTGSRKMRSGWIPLALEAR